MIESVYFSDPVVPGLEHSTQAVAGPHPITDLDVLNWDLTALSPDQSSLRNTTISATTKSLRIFLSMRAEKLGLGSVGPADHGATDSVDHASGGIVCTDPGRTGETGRGSVAEGRCNDPHPMRRVPRQASRATDVVHHVLRTCVRFA